MGSHGSMPQSHGTEAQKLSARRGACSSKCGTSDRLVASCPAYRQLPAAFTLQ